MTPAPAPSAKVFFLIRLAMTVGVITFIAIAWFLQGRGEIPARSVSSLTALTTAMYTAVGIAAAVIMALRLRIASAEPAMRRSLSVVAWAVGELAARLGGGVGILPIAIAIEHRLTVDQLAEAFSVYPSLSGSITDAARAMHIVR